MSQRETGHVKWFNEKKGFGFIVNQQGDDIFVHYKDIQGAGFKTLHENDFVTYLLDKGPKGFKAQEVALANQDDTGTMVSPPPQDSQAGQEARE